MIEPWCKKTCGLCGMKKEMKKEESSECADDNAAVAKAAGAFGVTACKADLCEGQYKEMMAPLCKKTCGTCSAMAAPTTTAAAQTKLAAPVVAEIASSMEIVQDFGDKTAADLKRDKGFMDNLACR